MNEENKMVNRKTRKLRHFYNIICVKGENQKVLVKEKDMKIDRKSFFEPYKTKSLQGKIKIQLSGIRSQ